MRCRLTLASAVLIAVLTTATLCHAGEPARLPSSRSGKVPDGVGGLSLAEAVHAVNAQAARLPETRSQKPLTEEQVLKAIREILRDETVPQADHQALKEIAAARRLPGGAMIRQFVRYNDGSSVEHGWWVRLILPHEGGAPFILPIRQESIFRRPYTQKERIFWAEVRRTGAIGTINRLVAYFDEDPKFTVVQRFSPQEADRLAAAVKKAVNDKKADELLKCYDWDGVDQGTRVAVSAEAEQLVKRDLSSVSVSPRRFGGRLTQRLGFQTWDPNLPVLGYVVLEFAGPDAPKSVWLEFGEARPGARLVNDIVSRDDGPRLVGKPVSRPIRVTGFPLVRLPDGSLESCIQIDAPDELPGLQHADQELRIVQP